jgi:carboxylate-amine ligase
LSHAFGRAFTLGVEEELLLLDAGTLELEPAVERVVPEPTERLKTELFACLAETTTEICESADQVLGELRTLRDELARRAEPLGVVVAASGSHPFGGGAGQRIVEGPVYRKMQAALGEAIYRQLVCGLHVHVGMSDPEACLRALEGVLPWLPVLLSLSANSPYVEGEAGPLSGRAQRLAELPRAEAPPAFRSWEEFEAFARQRDFDRMWWDARPHPGYGTLEVRIADQQTDVRRSAGFAALVQALAATAAEGEGVPEPYDRALYARRRAGAALAPPDPEDVGRLAAFVEPAARRLGGWSLVTELLAGPPECERQLEVGRAEGLRAVAADLVARSHLPSS